MAGARTIRTTCPYCGVGCGVLAKTDAAGKVSIEGDPEHPANFGRLCSKGSALADVLTMEGRLLHPLMNGKKTNWDAALNQVASRFKAVIDEHGPDAAAFYVSGQLLTEDYYVANKLMKGYIGSGNIDTNSRLCMASSVAGHKRAFGEDVVPGTYEDLEQADLLILTGSNLAWCHPVLYQRIVAAKAARPHMMIVVIDPRETATTDAADLHLALKPGSDIALFQGLLKWLSESPAMNADYISASTQGAQDALRAAQPYSIGVVSKDTGLCADDLERFYGLVAATDKTVTVYSQGVNQAEDGTDRVGAIINTHLLTGRLGKPGMGPFSVTGQPNAMGGREVGGLANQLACHMDISHPAHRDTVQRFWGSPTLCEQDGLKAVEMFDAVADGRIKAIWIIATNPVDSLPNADKVRAALEACPTVVVSDVTAHSDTARCADIVLPAAAWGEKDGTVTNSERCISRQRPLRDHPGQVRADWEIICDVARRMGWTQGFEFQSAAEIFREYAAMTAFENDGARLLDLGAYAHIDEDTYARLTPMQWPLVEGKRQGGRLFADGNFSTKTRRAHFVSPKALPATSTSAAYPYTLNTGRIRDHWHTMTRTGVSSKLSQHFAEPFAEIHPEDALKEGICHASLMEVSSPYGRMVVRALLTKRQRRGSLFVPMHWTDEFASHGRVDALIAPVVDPLSGQPALKSTAVTLAPYVPQWHGFIVTKRQMERPVGDYWARARCVGGYRLECAGVGTLEAAERAFKQMMGAKLDALSYLDGKAGQQRTAFFDGDDLIAAGFFSGGLVDVSRQWAANLLQEGPLSVRARAQILAGRPGADSPDPGAIVCACMDVGINTIKAAAQSAAGCVDSVGEITRAGTNCGSCRAEIKRILADMETADDDLQKAS